VNRRGIQSLDDLCKFLTSADYSNPTELCRSLFPHATADAASLRIPDLIQEGSPFIVGPPIHHPRQFFGREQQLKRIFGVVAHFPLQHIAVVGPRRSGKTSLLHYLQSIGAASPTQLRPGQKSRWLHQPEAYRWVYVDFQDARLHNQEKLLQYILSGLGLPTPEACSLSDFMDIVSAHLVLPSIIMMDELELAFRARGLSQEFFWESLRSLACNGSDGRLGLIVASRDHPHQLPANLKESSSPFLNIFGHTIELGPFPENEALQLIESSPRKISLEDCAWIQAKSQGWPVLLQALCLARLTAPDDTWKTEGLQQIEQYRPLLEIRGQ
jgi:hypothetical protein